MNRIATYLDEAVDLGRAKNDADIAAKLAVSRSAVSNWRAGVKAPDDDLAIGLAKLIDRDPREVMAFCASKRAKTEEARKEWESIGLELARAKSKTGRSVRIDPFSDWRARRDSNARPLPSEGSTLSS